MELTSRLSLECSQALDMGGEAAKRTEAFEPLSADEIAVAAKAVKAHAALLGLPPLRFNTTTLYEAPKREYFVAKAEHRVLPRRAFVVLQTPPERHVYEATVHLSDAAVEKWTKIDASSLDGQPLASTQDCKDAERISRAEPRVQALLIERGVDPSNVCCDPWAVHNAPPEWPAGGRLMQVFFYLRACPHDNEYAHPLDLIPVVDLLSGRVIHVDHFKYPPAVPMRMANYHRALVQHPFRTDMRPLHVTQPEGPSFIVDGWSVAWSKWRFQMSFNAREGLVLHEVRHGDPDGGPGCFRPVLHRASIVEMAVPYGDPRPPHNRKCALDAGDYGLGLAANSLILGCDCLGAIRYFDAVFCDAEGKPVTLKNAVCMHEEDTGLLWKHVDYFSGYSESRRARRLVVSFVMTAVNYEYAFYWYFNLDGSIGHEIKLTGLLSTSLPSPGEDPVRPSHGTLVEPGVVALHHQHFFCARLDFSVDCEEGGRDLVVAEVDADPSGDQGPAGNGFTALETDLLTTHSAQRLADPALARVWKVKNPNRHHPVTGEPVSYAIIPGAHTARLMANSASAVFSRAPFCAKNLWVTPHHDRQSFPSGEYVMQSRKCTGLSEWTLADEPLPGRDPVCWYCFGVTHIVRPEDWPVMPCEVVGFAIKPVGFFRCSPSLDVAPELDRHSVLIAATPAAANLAPAAAACCAGAGAATVGNPRL